MWKCSCGEEHEDSFDTCWKCGGARPYDIEDSEAIDDESEESFLEPSGVVTLREEEIAEKWATLVYDAAGNAASVYADIQRILDKSNIPGGCYWQMVEVKGRGMSTKQVKYFLQVNLEQFGDYHVYIGIRDYGIHLDCCWFLTVEPGFFKEFLSEKITGDGRGLSSPKNILLHQDLRAWITVVDFAVKDSIDVLLKRLEREPHYVEDGSKDFLQIW